MLKHIYFLMIFALFIGCSQKEDPNKPFENIAELEDRYSELNDLSTDLENQRSNLFRLIREFNSTRPESEQFDITSMDTLMGSPERELLKAMFKEEKDISYNGLLRNIIEKNNEIAQLNEKIMGLNEQITNLENRLPKPYIVQKGDTHYQLVRDFLMNQNGMDKKQAREVAWKTVMTDNLLPGNKIWLSYDTENNLVVTYVTQGDAKIAPMTYEQIAKKRMIQKAIDEAKAQPVTTETETSGAQNNTGSF